MKSELSHQPFRPRTYWPEIMAAIVLLVGWLMIYGMSLSHDVVWQMWIARQLIGGSKLYVDILELNPPLWFWMAVPAEYMAQTLQMTANNAIITAILTYAGVSLALFAATITKEAPSRRAILLVSAAAIMLLINLEQFAQREHLALIGSLPYVALIARRADGARVPFAVAAMIGGMAAFGFALKHYFVAVPILLELWLILRLRRSWSPFRSELIVLACLAVAYAFAVIFWTPEYFRVILPMLLAAYNDFGLPFWMQFWSLYVAYWAICAVLLLISRKDAATSLTWASALGAAGFVFSYFAQQKGWSYHALPAIGLAVFSVCSMLMSEHSGISILRRAVLIPFVAIAPMFISVRWGPYDNAGKDMLRSLAYKPAPGSSVVMLTTNPSRIWPMVESEGYIWPSRHFSFWMIVAIQDRLRKSSVLSPELQQIADEIRTQTAIDFLCNPPSIILIDDIIPGFSYIDFFNKNEYFRQVFLNYKRSGTVETYDIYIKDDQWNPDKGRGCKTIF